MKGSGIQIWSGFSVFDRMSCAVHFDVVYIKVRQWFNKKMRQVEFFLRGKIMDLKNHFGDGLLGGRLCFVAVSL